MGIRSLSIRAFVPAACFVMASAAGMAQQTPPASSQTTPATGSQAAQTTPVAPPPASKEPDYPDQRSFFIGITGLSPLKNSGPDVRGGKAAGTNYESLYGIGTPYHGMIQGEAGIPVTRTGMLYVDFERFHGEGTQIIPKDAFVNSQNYSSGDTVQSAYHIITGRIYLDDLLYPHKFPVSKFRFKSIWGIRYVSVTETSISPTEDNVSGQPGGSFGLGTNYIMLPEFGAAMEYAIAKHALFRIDGAGFAIPHHSALYETSASLSVRHKNIEVLAGVKTLHFKTTPSKEEYEIGTFVSPFVGFRWYF